jgi:hypothetical protein
MPIGSGGLERRRGDARDAVATRREQSVQSDRLAKTQESRVVALEATVSGLRSDFDALKVLEESLRLAPLRTAPDEDGINEGRQV